VLHSATNIFEKYSGEYSNAHVLDIITAVLLEVSLCLHIAALILLLRRQPRGYVPIFWYTKKSIRRKRSTHNCLDSNHSVHRYQARSPRFDEVCLHGVQVRAAEPSSQHPLAYAQSPSLISPTQRIGVSIFGAFPISCCLFQDALDMYPLTVPFRILSWKQYAASIVDVVEDHGALLGGDNLYLFAYYATPNASNSNLL
jgi:hypothetical protein